MKHYPVLILLLCLGACQPKTDKSEDVTTSAQQTAIADTLLITPGKSIGPMALGGNMDSVAQRLGKPYRSDGAMGSALLTWYNNADTTSFQTNILGTRNMGGTDENILHIKKILVTSPQYKTADSVHTGLDLATIQKHYTLTQKGTYKTHGQTVSVYADKDKGIGFEINPLNQMCVGITVFKAGDEATANINMH